MKGMPGVKNVNMHFNNVTKGLVRHEGAELASVSVINMSMGSRPQRDPMSLPSFPKLGVLRAPVDMSNFMDTISQ